jgi:hypothetical protein
MADTPEARCARCGEVFPLHDGHVNPDGGPTTSFSNVGDGENPLYSCADCGERGGTFSSILHMCEDQDALGFGGHHAFISDLTGDDVRRAMKVAFVPTPKSERSHE